MLALAYLEITARANARGMSGEGTFTVYGEDGSYMLRYSNLYEGFDIAWDMLESDCFERESITVEHVVYYYNDEEDTRNRPFYAVPSTRERVDGWRGMAYAR
jgi:hypothetical protein